MAEASRKSGQGKGMGERPKSRNEHCKGDFEELAEEQKGDVGKQSHGGKSAIRVTANRLFYGFKSFQPPFFMKNKGPKH